jgi:hypothetical protein
MALLVKAGENLLHYLFMPGLRGADEIIIRALQPGSKAFPNQSQLVTVLLWLLMFGDRGLLHLLPVLIQTGQEIRVLAHAPARARNHIGDYFLIGVAQVRRTVDVINGCRQIKAFAHLRLLWPSAAPLARIGGFGLVKGWFVHNIELCGC